MMSENVIKTNAGRMALWVVLPVILLGAWLLDGRGVALGQDNKQGQVVRAQRFIVVDKHGHDVGEFGVDGDSVRLRIPGNRGEPGVFVGIQQDGARGVVLFDERGQPLAEFGLRTGDSPPTLWLGVRGAPVKQRPRVILYSESGGNPGLVFFDKEGKLTWSAPIQGD